MNIKASELILNADGSIYHLNLKPADIAPIIITVGDPDRAERVSEEFDYIEFKIQKREFKTITGNKDRKRITVISTGIGTDNIDIVFNELDALVNIDLETRLPKTEHTQLTFIRIGTSGCLISELGIDALLISAASIGTDNLVNFYKFPNSDKLRRLAHFESTFISPYYVKADRDLVSHFSDPAVRQGITVTANGFYGPQRRSLRIPYVDEKWLENLMELKIDNLQVTNLEMETAGIYALSTLLGHRAISINALLANRANGTFSSDPAGMEKKMIDWAMKKIMTL